MLTAPSVEAAAAAGIGARTARRYLSSPAVKDALNHALDEALHQATTRAVAAMAEALDTLASIHADKGESAPARVSAARAILVAAPRLHEAMELAQRVAALEKKLEES